jgi:hypothetical protein
MGLAFGYFNERVESYFYDPKSHIKHGQYKWDVWDIPNEEIIQYMRDTFPKNVSDENDDKVCDFWFSEDCPQIAWIDQKTGEIFGS